MTRKEKVLPVNDVKVRPFERFDHDMLAELYVKSRIVAFPWLSPEHFKLTDFDWDTKGESILVMLAGEVIIGFSSSWLPQNFLHNIFIHPDYLRKGYGTVLLGETLKILELPVRLKCQKNNNRAIEFYNYHGWYKVGEGETEIGEYYILEYRGNA